MEWRSLAILLLGLSPNEADRTRVLRTMQEKAHLSGILNLDAWATAYIEIAGVEGIDQLSVWYIQDSSRSQKEIESIVRAFSTHASIDPILRPHVVAAYRDLLGVHPDSAPRIVHDLLAWRQWDFVQPLQQISKQITKRDPLAAYALNLYLQQAAMHAYP
jgi:hypothetical protein